MKAHRAPALGVPSVFVLGNREIRRVFSFVLTRKLQYVARWLANPSALMSQNVNSHDSTKRWRDWIRLQMAESAEVKLRAAEANAEQILTAANSLIRCFQANGKTLICGNGGSAADAQHMAAEFVNRLSPEIERPGLPAIALTTDSSFITSYANDLGYEGIFERQVLTLGNSQDVLIAISTSGSSANVTKAVLAARTRGLETIGFVGERGQLAEIVDYPIVVPSRNTQHIQECFLSIEHVICGIVEQTLFGNAR